MPGGFWIFLLIVVANLVITIIKKAAEKKAKAAGESAEASPSSSGEAPRRRFTGEGDHEMVLERAGDDRLRVIDILRKELRWDLPTAMTLAGTTPSVVATGLTRSEAGYLRNRFESVGAGVSLRRRRSESVSTARDLDLERKTSSPSPSPSPSVRSDPDGRQDTGRAAALEASELQARRAEALRRRTSAPDRSPRIEAPVARPPRREVPASPPPPVLSPEVAARVEVPDLPPPRVARAARRAAVDRPMPIPGEASATDLRGRVLAVTRDRDKLREAFLLQELLRPPLSLRASGSGGRDS